MVFNSNYGACAMQVPTAAMVSAAAAGFLPVCGAMFRSHLIKE